jgi:AcrR family transcriptional regulator
VNALGTSARASASRTREAAQGAPGAGRSLSGEKAQRIIDAMRHSVARRGAAGSTFDRVSREAGVSRGLLHYYFGTKEQLLVEAVRRDTEVRLAALELLVATARTAEDYIKLMEQNLRATVAEQPDYVTLVFELFTLSRRNEEIAAEYEGLLRRSRARLAEMLALGQREGVLRLHAPAEAVAETLFALADGFALRMLADSEFDFTHSFEAARTCARSLLTD